MTFNPTQVLFYERNFPNGKESPTFQSYLGSILHLSTDFFFVLILLSILLRFYFTNIHFIDTFNYFNFQSYLGSILPPPRPRPGRQFPRLSILLRFYFTFFDFSFIRSTAPPLSILLRFYFTSSFKYTSFSLRLSILLRFYFTQVVQQQLMYLRLPFNPTQVLFYYLTRYIFGKYKHFQSYLGSILLAKNKSLKRAIEFFQSYLGSILLLLSSFSSRFSFPFNPTQVLFYGYQTGD